MTQYLYQSHVLLYIYIVIIIVIMLNNIVEVLG